MLVDYKVHSNVLPVLEDSTVAVKGLLPHLVPALQVIIALKVAVFQCLRSITAQLVCIALVALLVHQSVPVAIIPTQVE